jgi:hypothetical protein
VPLKFDWPELLFLGRKKHSASPSQGEGGDRPNAANDKWGRRSARQRSCRRSKHHGQTHAVDRGRPVQRSSSTSMSSSRQVQNRVFGPYSPGVLALTGPVMVTGTLRWSRRCRLLAAAPACALPGDARHSQQITEPTRDPAADRSVSAVVRPGNQGDTGHHPRSELTLLSRDCTSQSPKKTEARRQDFRH